MIASFLNLNSSHFTSFPTEYWRQKHCLSLTSESFSRIYSTTLLFNWLGLVLPRFTKVTQHNNMCLTLGVGVKVAPFSLIQVCTIKHILKLLLHGLKSGIVLLLVYVFEMHSTMRNPETRPETAVVVCSTLQYS